LYNKHKSKDQPSKNHHRPINKENTMKKENTFAGLPGCADLGHLDADIALLGIPYATPYTPDKPPHSENAPHAIRHESNRYPDDPLAWDFDIDGTLLGDTNKSIVDCGDLPGSQADPAGNRRRIQDAIASILAANAIPVVLGGDDSIPIPVMQAYAGSEPFHVLQMDAHIDWRDDVGGVRDGYSSTMRRASELDCVAGIVQAGMRGIGSARAQEIQAASAYGAHIIPARTIMHAGIDHILQHFPAGSRCFLTIDFDVLDPAIMPAVGAPTPGGLDYQTTIDLIHALARRNPIVGVCLVEFVPEADLRNLGAITAMRIVWNVLAALARN
jgi:agmatinase